MGSVHSHPFQNYYSQYFKPHPYHLRRRRRITHIDKYIPVGGHQYDAYIQQFEQDVAADRYEEAYDQLTARSKLSKVHGLEAYCEDRGWC